MNYGLVGNSTNTDITTKTTDNKTNIATYISSASGVSGSQPTR